MTPEQAISELRGFDSQIIHGPRTFGEIAEVIEKLVADKKAPACLHCKNPLVGEHPGLFICWECDADAGKKIAEAKAETERTRKQLQAIQDHGAEWDIYAEPEGKWSIREKSGERTLFPTIRECADTIIANEAT